MKLINCKIVISILAVVSAALISSCEDRLTDDSTTTPDREGVDVTLTIGLDQPQDAFDLLPGGTRATSGTTNSGFSAELIPTETDAGIRTASGTQVTPDKLYNLEIGLYDASGNNKYYKSLGSPAAGSYLTLDNMTAGEYQLVLIARGSTGILGSINGKTLAKVRTDINAVRSKIATIPVTASTSSEINPMPYALYLEKVKITADGKLTSPDTPTDIRLLLKRLAARVTLKWSYQVSGYDLTEVSLQQVPQLYRGIPNFQTNVGGIQTYPSLVDEFTDAYRLTAPGNDNTATGGYTIWVPANVRGIVPEVVNPSYRSKDNAPTASMFAEFRLENTTAKKRLFCRVYIGANQANDFNIYENTDYTWNVALTKADVTGDDRVTEQNLNPITSSNLVTTSNCFMMEPGTDICFNPYKHEAGTNGLNTYLNGKTIAKVELLWQSKDAGTSGELVLGYVATADDHRNLVNYENLSDRENARVYVKAPRTQGGNAVIAAYDSSNTIVWSWHLWLTDYIPIPLSGDITDDASRERAIVAAKAATMNGKVQTYGSYAWVNPSGFFYKKVIMDRNLGAIRGTYSIDYVLDGARAYGYLYQWGRKDPIPGSLDGTATEIGVLYDGEGEAKSLRKGSGNNLEHTIQNPDKFVFSLTLPTDSWGESSIKTIYDPCPVGWRVPDFTSATEKNIFADMQMSANNTRALVKGVWMNTAFNYSETNYDVKNGFLYKNEVWFPVFRLREVGTGALRDPYAHGYFIGGDSPSYTAWGASARYIESKISINNTPTAIIRDRGYGFGVRCVQK